MRTIFAHLLALGAPEQELYIPVGATILTIQPTKLDATLWVMGDPDAPLERRRILQFRSGTILPDYGMTYLATIAVTKVGEVYHVFETKAL